MGQRAGRTAFAGIVVITALIPSDCAWAANGAYVVDAADISEVGSCKVESWLSTASNTDFSAVANPSCVVDIVRPVELSMQTVRFRGDGDLGTNFAPRAKWNIVPTAIGKLGVAFYAGGALDAATGESLTAFAVVPATYRLSQTMRINVNAGWLRDRPRDRHYRTYGLGFDWKLTDVLQWTIEAFGQAGASDVPSVVRPRFQTGMRYRPNEIFSVDLIRPQHHGRKRQLDHDRDHDPVSGAGQQARASPYRPFVRLASRLAHWPVSRGCGRHVWRRRAARPATHMIFDSSISSRALLRMKLTAL